jgi:hypothetical protein
VAADPEAATAAAIAVTATAPAASAVRPSRLAGLPTPAIAPSSDRRRLAGGVTRGARSGSVFVSVSVSVGPAASGDVSLPVSFM